MQKLKLEPRAEEVLDIEGAIFDVVCDFEAAHDILRKLSKRVNRKFRSWSDELRYEIKELKRVDKLFRKLFSRMVPLALDLEEEKRGNDCKKMRGLYRRLRIPTTAGRKTILLGAERYPAFERNVFSRCDYDELIDLIEASRCRLDAIDDAITSKMSVAENMLMRQAISDEMEVLYCYRGSLLGMISRNELLLLGVTEAESRRRKEAELM